MEKRKLIIDKVHNHVFGHSSFTDIKSLLERNGIWNDDAHKCLSTIIETCSSCNETSLPKQARKVLISSMSREFNEVVCIDHLFLDEVPVFHAKDSVTRYSVGTIVPDTKLLHAISLLIHYGFFNFHVLIRLLQMQLSIMMNFDLIWTKLVLSTNNYLQGVTTKT